MLTSLFEVVPVKAHSRMGKTKVRGWDRLQWNFIPFPQNVFCLPDSMETQQPVVPKGKRVAPKMNRIVKESGLHSQTEI